MHLYMITRGVKHEVDHFITQLQGKFLPCKVKPDTIFGSPNPNGKVENYHFQLGVRPIQLWEIVFPEEHRDVILTTILGKDKGIGQHRKHDKIRWALRKALGIEPIPDYDASKMMPICRSVETIGIGIKEDYWFDKDGSHKAGKDVDKKDPDVYEGL